MPAMKRASVPGCCAGSLFYNIGVAHSRTPAKDLDQFANHLLTLSYSTVNTVITNDSQGNERKFLEACGFKEVSKQGRLHVHVGWATDIQKALEPWRVAKQKKVEEERIARQKLEEEKRKQAAAARLAQAEATAKLLKKDSPSQQMWPKQGAGDLRALIEATPENRAHIRQFGWSGMQSLIAAKYGFMDVKPSITYWGERDYSSTARKINLRLERSGRLLK